MNLPVTLVETRVRVDLQRFRVSVCKDSFTFCAAHFITYRGHQCESLHGHNYRVAIMVEGQLTADRYVVDFGDLKALGRTLCNRLDHAVLLPERNPLITLASSGGQVKAHYRDRHYSFPASDVRILPIQNTTAEALAAYLAEQVTEALWSNQSLDIGDVEVSVDESEGQTGVCRMKRPTYEDRPADDAAD